MELAGLFPWLPSLFLHFVRVGAFFVGQPMFGVQSASKTLRLILMVSLGAIFFWVNGMPIVPVSGLGDYGLLVAREALIGFALGFCIRLMTSTLKTAGEILSHEMGFAMAQVVDPATGKSSPVISMLFETVALLLIFELNIHHHVLLSFATAKTDPMSGGRHKVLGSKTLHIPPQTSTIASHLPKAVGAAYSIGLARRRPPEHGPLSWAAET